MSCHWLLFGSQAQAQQLSWRYFDRPGTYKERETSALWCAQLSPLEVAYPTGQLLFEIAGKGPVCLLQWFLTGSL